MWYFSRRSLGTWPFCVGCSIRDLKFPQENFLNTWPSVAVWHLSWLSLAALFCRA